MKLSIVVAMAANGRGIGREGGLPWKLSKEMSYFKKLTCYGHDKNKNMKNAVIMGRKTWESIPKKFRPLSNRLNVVLSNSLTSNDVSSNVILASSLDDALMKIKNQEEDINKVFVIGGEGIFKEALSHDDCEEIFLTQIYGDFNNCDAFFPKMEEGGGSFRCLGTPSLAPLGRQTEGQVEYEFFHYVKEGQRNNKTEEELNPALCLSPNSASSKNELSKRHEEYQYLDMIQNILANGIDKGDRTGTGTRSIFGTTMRFSLRDDTLPLLTTKRVFWRGVAEELLWFISGDTNAKTLQDKNIHIWDGNGSREYLDKIGLTDREEGDLGPVYGFQWRHFGAEYKTMHDNYKGAGVDQLVNLVNTLKTNPNDRRMIISAWNPAAFKKMALPPCHMFAQFYVANGELSCQMYQRSADMGLGVPFNIASYALLTRLLAQCTGLKAGDFIHVIGDCHIYKNHIEPLKEQLKREPTVFPKLKINSNCTDIDGFKYEDFEVVGYKPHKSIKMEMSV